MACFRFLELPGIRPFVHVGQDDSPGAPLAAILGYSYWQRRFGGNPVCTGAHAYAGWTGLSGHRRDAAKFSVPRSPRTFRLSAFSTGPEQNVSRRISFRRHSAPEAGSNAGGGKCRCGPDASHRRAFFRSSAGADAETVRRRAFCSRHASFEAGRSRQHSATIFGYSWVAFSWCC